MAVGRRLEVGFAGVSVNLLCQPALPICDMQIATCMIEPLSRKREDADAAVPVQQGAHRQFDLEELADFGERLVQCQASLDRKSVV